MADLHKRGLDLFANLIYNWYMTGKYYVQDAKELSGVVTGPVQLIINRRVREPYARWCGRPKAERPLLLDLLQHKAISMLLNWDSLSGRGMRFI